MRKVIIFELNEYNDDLLNRASKELGLKNIQKALSFKKTTLRTDDTYSSNFLEPWVQWVSVHTGTPSSKHQIKHLGDVPRLDYPQLWEHLSDNKVTSGVWGLMNASRNAAENCLFFVPDPWTFSERAYPAELNALLDLPRYMSKNYLNLSTSYILKKLLTLLNFIGKVGLWKILLAEMPHLVNNMIRFKNEHFVFISFIDYISSKIFLLYKKKYDPDLSMIFLNGIAHLQHHHWDGFDYKNNKRLIYGLEYVDRILKYVFDSISDDHTFIMMTALSQKNTNAEDPWILYRQLDQMSFLQSAGIECIKVEPHMTYDAHVFFKTKEDCQKAIQVLRDAEIKGKPLFLIETYPEDNQKLFYRIDFADLALPSEIFTINGKALKFFDYFKTIVQRTGKHIPVGTMYSNNAENIPEELYNHELLPHLASLFEGKPLKKVA